MLSTLPVMLRQQRHAPPHTAMGPGSAPQSIAPTALTDRGQQPINRGAAHRQHPCPHGRLKLQVSMVLQRFHQLRQQGMEPLAAEPITGFPERHQRLNHLAAVATPVLASLAALPLIRPLVQPPQKRFAVIAGERLQFIQQPLFPRAAQAPVTHCCSVDCQCNPLPLFERARSAWPQALCVTPRLRHGRLAVLMQ